MAGLGAENAAQAWDRFFRIYQGYILSHARARGLGEADAQDVLQVVMLVVAREACGFHYYPATRVFTTANVSGENAAPHEFVRFRAWLKGLIQIKTWEVQRFRRRGGPPVEESAALDLPDEAATPAEALDAASEQAHRQALLAQALEFLCDSYRGSPRNVAVFEAVFLRGESPQAVAEAHGITANYAGVIVHTLKERLREILTQLLAGTPV